MQSPCSLAAADFTCRVPGTNPSALVRNQQLQLLRKDQTAQLISGDVLVLNTKELSAAMKGRPAVAATPQMTQMSSSQPVVGSQVCDLQSK